VREGINPVTESVVTGRQRANRAPRQKHGSVAGDLELAGAGLQKCADGSCRADGKTRFVSILNQKGRKFLYSYTIGVLF
jgi:hypothetical protein